MDYNPKTKEELMQELQALQQEHLALKASYNNDIAKSKQNEVNLQISEAQKKAILNGISANIAFVDKDLKIIWANKTAADSVNKTPEEMIGQTCHHFWADPSKPCENCPSLKALETKKTENTIIQTIDGRIWEERGEPIFDANGNLLGIVEIATDISERKQAENENERTQKLLEDSQRIGKIGGWEMNIDRGELKWTREMYNIHEVDATFKPNLDKRGNFYTPESLPIIDKAIQRAIEFGEPYEVDLEIITAKGNKRSIKTIGKADLENRRVFGLFQDITERKLTELALKKSELELKKAQQITHIGSWYLDLATNEVNWSEELYKMYGFDASLPPPPYTEHKKLFTPESWEILSSSLAHTSETGIPYELELKTIKHDGTNGWMWVRGETIKDSDNQTIGLWGAAQDISEHKYIEQILKESEEKYRLLTEFTADVVWVLNLASGKFSYISPSVFQLRGFTAEEAMLETLESALTPESITIVNNAIAKNVVTFIAQPEFPNHYINEIQQYCKNGEIIWVEVSTQFRYSPSGDIEVVGVSRNIENRKKAEETLRKSEIMLREAGKLAKLGGWEIDLATNKLTWTEETYNIHEVPTGNSPQLEDGIRFYAPEAQPILNRAIDRAINHGEPFDLELPFITAKGNHLWVRSIGNVEKANGLTTRLYGVFQDITERKQTEKALRENEEKYRTLVENSLVGVVQTNLKGEVLYVNDSFVKMYEATSAKEFIGAQMTGVYKYEHDRNEVLSLLKKDGRVDNFEVVGLTVKGNEKTRLLSAKVSGEVINGLVFDITERKQTEEELRNANSYLENLINYANAPIIVWDPQFRITRFNHAFENLTGLKESDVLGKSIEILFAAAAKDNSMELIRKTQSGERWETVEIEIQHCDGSLHTVLWNSATLFGPDDKTPIATIAQGQEITRRKKAEEELKQFSTRLSLATRAGGVGVWDWELSNNTLLWDDQMFVLYGASRESFSGAYSAWQAGLHPDDKVRCDEEIQKALKGEKEFNTEFRVVWPDGSIHFIRALAFVQRDEAGKALRMIGTNWDITKQKESEAEIKHKNEQLEKLNSEKDKFFSIIAHDLRGPFNGFLGLTQIMAEQFKSLTLTQLQEISMGLNKSAKNLFSLLNNLLEWSRMQRGTISFEPTAIPLLSFTTYALNPVMEPALKKGVAINIDIAETINVFADENMLSSIIRNLTTNAVKFTLKGGKVSLSAKTTADGYIEFSVQDTGIGMDAEIMDNMFKLDVSISRKGTEGEPSTGLGLFLCKDFIEKHGGRIWAESEEGKGSIFSFVIPKTH